MRAFSVWMMLSALALAEPPSRVTELVGIWKKCDASAQTMFLAAFPTFPESDQRALVRAAGERLGQSAECPRMLAFSALDQMRGRSAEVVEVLAGTVERRAEFLAAPSNKITLMNLIESLREYARDPVGTAALRNAYRTATPSTKRLLLSTFPLESLPVETTPDWIETLKSPIRQDASGKWRVPDNEAARASQLLAPLALVHLHREKKVDALAPLRAAFDATSADRELRSAVMFGLARVDDKGATQSIWMTQLINAGTDAMAWLAAAEGWDRVTEGKVDLKAFSGKVQVSATARCRHSGKSFEVTLASLDGGEPALPFVGSRRRHPFRFHVGDHGALSFIAPGRVPSVCDQLRAVSFGESVVALLFKETSADESSFAIAVYDPKRDVVLDARSGLKDGGWKWEDGYIQLKEIARKK